MLQEIKLIISPLNPFAHLLQTLNSPLRKSNTSQLKRALAPTATPTHARHLPRQYRRPSPPFSIETPLASLHSFLPGKKAPFTSLEKEGTWFTWNQFRRGGGEKGVCWGVRKKPPLKTNRKSTQHASGGGTTARAKVHGWVLPCSVCACVTPTIVSTHGQRTSSWPS